MVRATDQIDSQWSELDRRLSCIEATVFSARRVTSSSNNDGDDVAEQGGTSSSSSSPSIAERLSASVQRILNPLSDNSRTTLSTLFADLQHANAILARRQQINEYYSLPLTSFQNEDSHDELVDPVAFEIAAVSVMQRTSALIGSLKEIQRRVTEEQNTSLQSFRDMLSTTTMFSKGTDVFGTEAQELRNLKKRNYERALALAKRVDVLQNREAAIVAEVKQRLGALKRNAELREGE